MSRLKLLLSKELSDLPYKMLYERLRDHFAVKGNDAHFYNVLLLEVCRHVDLRVRVRPHEQPQDGAPIQAWAMSCFES